ncbi:threonine aldolase family protein [Planktotalea arctica]|uniref:threonine aldolase family protein n=1 Tax=Planktotalea arctica TaxID=1481893 RepID=UPI00321A9BF0
MFFASDNAGPIHPEVLEALARANEGYAMPYGADAGTQRVQAQIREIFEAPDAMVHLLATGTAANSIALACMCAPYETVFCSSVAHIHEDECSAPEFYSGGAKLTLVPCDVDKMRPDDLRASIAAEGTRGVHGPQRGAVSITQVAEKGSVHSLDELRALVNVTKEFKLPVHLDGARFANALATLGCSAAEMTWKLGIDAVSFGGTKNGLMGVEAVIFFDPKKSWEFELRRKRGAHLFSKGRYLSAQMEAYLANGLWLTSAVKANANMARLSNELRGLEGVSFLAEPDANMVFAWMPRAVHQRLHNGGAVYYLMQGNLEGDDPNEPLLCRLVSDWSISQGQIDQFIALARG